MKSFSKATVSTSPDTLLYLKCTEVKVDIEFAIEEVKCDITREYSEA